LSAGRRRHAAPRPTELHRRRRGQAPHGRHVERRGLSLDVPVSRASERGIRTQPRL